MNTTSNHFHNEADVNKMSQCKYDNQNENQNYDHFGYYQNHNQPCNLQYMMQKSHWQAMAHQEPVYSDEQPAYCYYYSYPTFASCN